MIWVGVLSKTGLDSLNCIFFNIKELTKNQLIGEKDKSKIMIISLDVRRRQD